MSTPPLPPHLPEDDLPPHPRSSLAKLAAVFATIFVVSLGLCGYSAHSSTEYFGGDLGFFSLVGMVISFVCLLAIGVTIVFRAIRGGYYN